MPCNVLVVDDDKIQQELTSRIVEKRLGAQAQVANHGHEALSMLNAAAFDVVIMDLNMPEMGGLEALKTLREQQKNDVPVIIMTASDELSDAVSAMQLGANDFITKPVEQERLVTSVTNALRVHELHEEVTRLRRKIGEDCSFDELIGHDTGLRDVVDMAKRAARSDIPMLVMGESGVGKEMFAKAIHQESERSGKPFIAVNCGAIPENLVESTLFGHEKGAFTGAVSKKIGKFQEAEGGTLFLDEVGELPLETQVKLLRALQEKDIEPVGAAKTVKVDVRIVSATNRPMDADVATGKFREDLFFRLNGIPLTIPPLRERVQDIPAFTTYFIEHFSDLHQQDIPTVTQGAVEYLRDHQWKGNVRELENAIYRAIILDTDGIITQASFSKFMAVSNDVAPTPSLAPAQVPAQAVEGMPTVVLCDEMGVVKPMKLVEEEAMHHAIEHFGGNVLEAAKALGVGKSTLYRRLSELKARG